MLTSQIELLYNTCQGSWNTQNGGVDMLLERMSEETVAVMFVVVTLLAMGVCGGIECGTIPFFGM